jgi:hypothetical protein
MQIAIVNCELSNVAKSVCNNKEQAGQATWMGRAVVAAPPSCCLSHPMATTKELHYIYATSNVNIYIAQHSNSYDTYSQTNQFLVNLVHREN